MFASVFVFVLGLVAMGFTARRTQGLGVKPLLILTELALAVPAVALGLMLRRRLPGVLASGAPTPGGAFRIVLLGIGFWIVSLGVFEAQYVLWKPPAGFLEQFRALHLLLKPSDTLDWIASFAAIAMSPAICEEIVFRGFIAPALAPAFTRWGSVLVSSALFGAIHIDDVNGTNVFYRVPFAFLLGVLFAELRFATGTLAAPVIAHATINALTFSLAPLLDDPDEVNPPERPLIAAGMLAVGGLWAWAARRGLGRSEGPPAA